jgi:zinc transport system substrate-binding protein
MLPGHRDTLEANLAAFLAGVDRVDTDLRNTFEPHQRKRFFVFHPAWGYFAREYGLVQVAIEREGHEPDPRSLARVIDEARAARVKVIFVQPQHNDASARLVAGEIGARIDTLDPLARDLFTNLRQAAAKISEGLVD